MIHVQVTNQMIEEIAEQYRLEFDEAEEMVQTIVGMVAMNGGLEGGPVKEGQVHDITWSPVWLSISWVTKGGDKHDFVIEPSSDHPLEVKALWMPGQQKLETVQIKGEPVYVANPEEDQVSITLKGARLKPVG